MKFNKTLRKDYDLETILNDIAYNFPTKDYFRNKGNTHVIHGATHACRTAFLVNVFYNFYKDSDGCAKYITPEILKMLQITAAFHDAGRQGEGEDRPAWENQGGEYAKQRLIDFGYDPNLAYWVAKAIPYKDKLDQLDELFKINNESLLKDPEKKLADEDYTKQLLKICITLLHESDCLEIDRVTTAFDKKELFCHDQQGIDNIIETHYKALDDFGDNPFSQDTKLQAQFENAKDAYSQIATKMCQHEIFAKLYDAKVCLNDTKITKSELATKPIGDIYEQNQDLDIQTLVSAIARASDDEKEIYKNMQKHEILFYHWVADEIKNRAHIKNIYHILSEAKIEIPKSLEELKKLKESIVKNADAILFFPLDNRNLNKILQGECIDVTQLAAEELADKHKTVFGVNPIEKSKINLENLKIELGKLSEDEQKLLKQVEAMLKNGEFRHQTSAVKNINNDGYLTSPDARRNNGTGATTTISTDSSLEGNYVYCTFGYSGHNDQLFLDPAKTKYVFPISSFSANDKLQAPFKHAMLRTHLFVYQAKISLGKFSFGDINIEITHSEETNGKRQRTFLLYKDRKIIKELKRDFNDDIAVGDDIIPFLSHLLILIARELGSFKNRLFSKDNETAIKQVFNDLLSSACFEVLIPHSIPINDKRITVINDTTKEQPFDEVAYEKMKKALTTREKTQIKAVLATGVPIDIRRTEKSPTPLLLALSNRFDSDTIRFLLKYGSDPAVCTPYHDALTLAIKNYSNDLTLIEAILSSPKVNLNKYYGWSSDLENFTSALIEATLMGNLDLIKLLFNHGLKLDRFDAEFAMMRAAKLGYFDIIDEFLNHNESLAWDLILPPIFYAIEEQQYDLITRLIKIDDTKLLTAISILHKNISCFEYAVEQVASHYIKGENIIAKKLEKAIFAGIKENKKQQFQQDFKNKLEKMRQKGTQVLAKKRTSDSSVIINLIKGKNKNGDYFVLLGQRSDHTGKAIGVYELPADECYGTNKYNAAFAAKQTLEETTHVKLDNNTAFEEPWITYNNEQLHVYIFADEVDDINNHAAIEGQPFVAAAWIPINKLSEFKIKPSHIVLIEHKQEPQTSLNNSINQLLWNEYAGPDALIDAIDKNDHEKIQKLLKQGVSVYTKSQKNLYNEKAETVLTYALRHSNVDILKLLVDEGNADLAKPIDGKNFDSPLTIAAAGGSVEIAKWILENGNEKDSRNWLSQSFQENLKAPLSEACKHAHVDMVKFLLSQGVSIQKQEGIFILDTLLTRTNDEARPDEHTVLSIINQLLKHGLDVNYYAEEDLIINRSLLPIKNLTTFYLAAKSGYPLVVKRLLEYDADYKVVKKRAAYDNLNAVKVAEIVKESKRNTALFDKYKAITMLFHKYSEMRKLKKYLIIAGNNTPEKKRQALIDEYRLVPLESGNLNQAKEFLVNMVKELAATVGTETPELMLIKNSSKLVEALPGFDKPTIAINTDFLLQLGKESTVEELHFGLIHELLFIKNKILTDNMRVAIDEYELDKVILQEYKVHPDVAFSYLRSELMFAKMRKLKPESYLNQAVQSIDNIKIATPTERIKMLQLSLAQNNPAIQREPERNHIPSECIDEISKVAPIIFFKGYPTNGTAVEQINYLTENLDELKKELYPYELTRISSTRVNEFCNLLVKINMDYSDNNIIPALNALVNMAFEKRISAFDKIYIAAIQGKRVALGPFAEFQDYISNFVSACDFASAQSSAAKIIEYSRRLENFQKPYLITLWSRQHLETYKYEHNGELPTGDDRYFGADRTFMEHAHINGFTPGKSYINHITWAKDDSIIKKALVRLGVKDDELWKLMDIKEQKLAKETKSIGSEIIRYQTDENGLIKTDVKINYEIMDYLSKNHVLDISMFNNYDNFETAFIDFFEKNIAQLENCTNDFNNDTDAVHALLKKFSEIAENGKPEDQEVVRSFFLGRSDERDLVHLWGTEKNAHSRESLTIDLPYAKFFWRQEYGNKSFKLFELKHIKTALDNYASILFDIKQLTAEEWLSIFKLSDASFTLDCIKQLIPLMDKYRISGCTDLVHNKHLEKHGVYNVLDPNTSDFIELIKKHDHGHCFTENMLQQIDWNMTDTKYKINVSSMTYIYRISDHYMKFPSLDIQQQYGKLIIDQINSVQSRDERIMALEKLLFINKNNFFEYPLSDVEFKNEVVRVWVENIAAKYGKDDDSQVYSNIVIPVITRVFGSSARRDLVLILSQLSNALQLQKKLSDQIGRTLEPEKYNLQDKPHYDYDLKIAIITKTFNYLADAKNDQKRTLEFLASPLNAKMLDNFATYLIQNKKADKIAQIYKHDTGRENFTEKDKPRVKDNLRIIYNQFWDLDLKQRSVAINHLLIPANTTVTKTTEKNAYNAAFDYVVSKLFPNQAENDDFAIALLKAYLGTADRYQRQYLLSALLVTTNETDPEKDITIGKKLALLCEHMGPAYVKLAQAIHSYPNTPEDLRADLAHIKGRANPPQRWELWRLMAEYLSEEEVARIISLENLLGSASYNLAVPAKFVIDTGNIQNLILLLQRENAKEDANNGFDHLKRAINACKHSKIGELRDTLLAMVHEAHELSDIELDKDSGDKQHKIAKDIYNRSILINEHGDITEIMPGEQIYAAKRKIGGKNICEIKFTPADNKSSGEHYRFLSRKPGDEYNDIPNEQQEKRKIIAKAVVYIELTNILSGKYFDCDRHGNQLRVKYIKELNQYQLGLYDFGEMSLKEMSDEEIDQVKQVLCDLANAFIRRQNLDDVIADHIKQAEKTGRSFENLMRIRKALLALNDFLQVLNSSEQLKTLNQVAANNRLHPQLKNKLSALSLLSWLESCISYGGDVLRFFREAVNDIANDAGSISNSYFNPGANIAAK